MEVRTKNKKGCDVVFSAKFRTTKHTKQWLMNLAESIHQQQMAVSTHRHIHCTEYVICKSCQLAYLGLVIKKASCTSMIQGCRQVRKKRTSRNTLVNSLSFGHNWVLMANLFNSERNGYVMSKLVENIKCGQQQYQTQRRCFSITTSNKKDSVASKIQHRYCTYSLLSSTFFTRMTSPKLPRPNKRTFSYNSRLFTCGGAGESNGAE